MYKHQWDPRCKLIRASWHNLVQVVWETFVTIACMASRGETILVLKPACMKRGYYFKSCRPYRSEGVQYDYRLYNCFGKGLALQKRGPLAS